MVRTSVDRKYALVSTLPKPALDSRKKVRYKPGLNGEIKGAARLLYRRSLGSDAGPVRRLGQLRTLGENP